MFETLEARRLMSAVVMYTAGPTPPPPGMKAGSRGAPAIPAPAPAPPPAPGMVMVTFSDGTTATQSGSGSLMIKGGSGPNATPMNVTVVENGISQVNGGAQIGLGNVLVDEYNPNTGQYEEATFSNVKAGKGIEIDAGNNGSTINFDGTTLFANIKGGSGQDFISFNDRGNGGTNVNAGKGNNVIDAVFSNNATITSGSGTDLIIIDSIDANGVQDQPAANNKIVVNSGGGNDVIVIYDGDVNLNSGKGGTDSVFLDTTNGAVLTTAAGTSATVTDF